MEYRQVELQSADTFMVCWLEDDPRLAVSRAVTLKEIPDQVWTITRIYNKMPENQRRTWRVGGVFDR